MKYCPECNAEYTDEAVICSDCQSMLLRSAEMPAASSVNACDNCSAEIDLDSDFCPQCGTLFADDQYSCTNHPTGVASGVCIICQQLFCTQCLSKKKNRWFCSEHSGIESSEGWVVVFSSPDFFEAKFVSGKLESAGITTNSFNTMNISVLADGFIDNALGRTIFRYPVKVFVPAHQFLDAQKILAEEETE